MEKGGNFRPVCKWHPRQQGEGVCAQCLRTSLEKLAAYQGEYQETLDPYSEALSTSSLTDFSREKDGNFHNFQPSYPSVSYRTRSKKEPQQQQDSSRSKGSTSSDHHPQKQQHKDSSSSSSKTKLSWGGAVHRIALLRSAFTSLWRSDRQTEDLDDKRKDSSKAGVKYHHQGRGVSSQNGFEEGRKERVYGLNGESYGVHSDKSLPGMHSEGSNGDLRRTATSTRLHPWGGSFVSKFTHRTSTGEETHTRWRRSKSSRETKRGNHAMDSDHSATDYGPRTPNDRIYDAPSPQPAPHSSTKASPWRFFSRSTSRRSPHMGFKHADKSETPKSSSGLAETPKSTRNNNGSSSSYSNPVSRGVSPKPDLPVSTTSAFSSPSLAKLDARSRVPHGSKSTSWSRALSPPSSNKLSPLYLAARLKEPNLVNCERNSEASGELVAEVRLNDVNGKGVLVPAYDGVHDVVVTAHALPAVMHMDDEESASVHTLSAKALSQAPATSQVKTERIPSAPLNQKVNRPRSSLVHASKSANYKRSDVSRGAEARKSSMPGTAAEAPLYRSSRGKASLAS